MTRITAATLAAGLAVLGACNPVDTTRVVAPESVEAPGLPAFRANCPSDVEVRADDNGPVLINNQEALVRTYSPTYFEANRAGLTAAITVNPDRSVGVTFTGISGTTADCGVV